MICKNCGAENLEHFKFCEECGVILEKEISHTNDQNESTDKYIPEHVDGNIRNMRLKSMSATRNKNKLF